MTHELSTPNAVTRRRVLGIGGAAVLTAAPGLGCDALSTEPSGAEPADQSGRQKKEQAPSLAERAAAGELPPLSDRLPSTPLVVQPNERVGVYGGTWRAALLGPTDTPWLDRAVGYEMLMRWKPDTIGHSLDELVPNVAEAVEANRGGTEYTVRLRAGMKWSDGQPFSADDIVFAVNDVMLNEELSPSPPAGLVSGGVPATVEQIDATTVRFSFAEPSGLFPHFLASKDTGLKPLTALPRHYLEDFHAEYAADLDSTLREEDAPDWVELFFRKTDVWNNPELPRLHAWIPRNALNAGDRITFERNPYYWKVDPDGSQLPYIDELAFELQDEEVLLLAIANGEVDMYDRMVTTMQNKPVLARSRDSGGYRFVDLHQSNANAAIISLNLTHEDPVKKEIFGNRDFRVGLSLAINRAEIIDTVYQRQGEAWQSAPLPDAAYFDETLATQHLEYDVDAANSHLDRAGYDQRDANGIRLGPDGAPISFRVPFFSRDYGFNWTDVMELVKEYWREVGVEITVKPEENSLIIERRQANKHDAGVLQAGPGSLDPHLMPRNYLPFHPNSDFAVPWAQWYQSGGTTGAEPSAPAGRQMELYDRVKATTDEDERSELMAEILQIAAEEFYSIGICRPGVPYAVVKNTFHNVPEGYIEASNYPNPGPTNPEQYFISERTETSGTTE